MDVHEDIHRAIENYLDVDEFRRYVNSAIQASRSVTWLIQKRKHELRGYDDWYPAWVASQAQRPVARWAIGARNKIVKEEDLATHSQLRLTYYGERLAEATFVYDVDPLISVPHMLAVLGEKIDRRPRDIPGWVQIERRWIDSEFPEHELLALIRENYRAIAQVVASAHAASGVSECAARASRRPCVRSDSEPELFCIPPGNPVPTAIIDARTGEVSRIGSRLIEKDEARIEVGRERYGEPKFFTGRDAFEDAEDRLALSRMFLEADGYSIPMLTFYGTDGDKRGGPVHLRRDRPREVMFKHAVDVLGAWQFDSVAHSTEIWLRSEDPRAQFPLEEGTLPPDTQFYDPPPFPGDREALRVTCLGSDGRALTLTQVFRRTEDGILFGAIHRDEDASQVMRMMRPLFERWRAWDGWEPAV